jgi:hypothetical protein
MTTKITPRQITDRYTNEDLMQYGIHLQYIVNPHTFESEILVFMNDRKIVTKPFKKYDWGGYIDQYINEFVEQIITIQQRKDKINNLKLRINEHKS